MRKGSYLYFLTYIFLGLLFGGIFGEVLGTILGQIGVISGGEIENPVRTFFIRSFEFGWGIHETGMTPSGKPIYQADVLNLGLLVIPFAFQVKLNICSVLGLVISLYIMKWSK